MDNQKGKVILLNSEGCGTGDNELGFSILVALIENLATREERPIAIVCWNTAVKLLAKDSPLISRLKDLEEKGISILAGKLCVEELGLTNYIVVGKVVTMDAILDLLLHNNVVTV